MEPTVKYLSKDSAASTGLSWQTIAGGGAVPDASSTTKGLVQLTGDLGGTAASPTVPGLASKANTSALANYVATSQKGAVNGVASLDGTGKVPSSQLPSSTAPVTSVASKTGDVTLVKADVGLTNVDNTSDANKPVSSATQTALNAKAADSAVVHNTGAETVAGVKTFSSSPIVPTPTTNTQAANKSYVDGVAGAGAPDASTSSKGIVQLAGDLAGTATSVTVAKVNGVTVTGTPSTGQVLKATSASAATWQADATGGGGSSWSFSTVTANTTAADNTYVLADASSTGITVTLPVASNGAKVRVKRMSSGANSVQIVPQGPALIDGSGVGSHVLGNQWDAIEFVSDGTNWYRG